MRTGDKYTRPTPRYYTYAGRTDDPVQGVGIGLALSRVDACVVSTHQAALEAAVVPAGGHRWHLLKPKAFMSQARSSRAASHCRIVQPARQEKAAFVVNIAVDPLCGLLAKTGDRTRSKAVQAEGRGS